MTPLELLKLSNQPCKLLGLKENGEFIYVQLNRSPTPDETQQLETEKGVRFFKNCNIEEKREMIKFIIEMEAGRDQNPHLYDDEK